MSSNHYFTDEDHAKMQWYKGYRSEYYDGVSTLLHKLRIIVEQEYLINESLQEYKEHRYNKDCLLTMFELMQQWCRNRQEY